MNNKKQETLWDNAHIDYRNYVATESYLSNIDVKENGWHEKFVKDTPNGGLLVNNSFFDLLKGSTVYLQHTTCNLENILKSGCLLPSGGSLVGSIYCTPLFKEGKVFRVHNLGQYIHEVEAPRVANNCKPESLIIEISQSDHYHNKLLGLDYLKLGEVEHDIFDDLSYFCTTTETIGLFEGIVTKAKKHMDLFEICNRLLDNPDGNDEGMFFKLLTPAIVDIPVLGYLYFVAVSEYIMLFQTSDKAVAYHKIGEFYNPPYKELMYFLKHGYRLGSFSPSLQQIVDFLTKNNIFERFDRGEIQKFLIERLAFLICVRLFNNYKSVKNISTWGIGDYMTKAKPLLGHMINKDLDIFKLHPSMYFYFEQNKALQVWRYWNEKNIKIPFNGVIPKGEVGINPAYPKLSYKIYQGKVDSKTPFSYIRPVKELKIKIIPELVDVKFTLMRHNVR